MPAGHATIKGQMLISCILARSLRAAPHTLPSPLPGPQKSVACPKKSFLIDCNIRWDFGQKEVPIKSGAHIKMGFRFGI